MSAFSRGLLAVLYEVVGLALVYVHGSGSAAPAWYFAVHGVACGFAALTLAPLLRARVDRPLAAFLFLSSISFFVPVAGVVGMLGAAALARLGSPLREGDRFEMHPAPVYDPR